MNWLLIWSNNWQYCMRTIHFWKKNVIPIHESFGTFLGWELFWEKSSGFRKLCILHLHHSDEHLSPIFFKRILHIRIFNCSYLCICSQMTEKQMVRPKYIEKILHASTIWKECQPHCCWIIINVEGCQLQSYSWMCVTVVMIIHRQHGNL